MPALRRAPRTARSRSRRRAPAARPIRTATIRVTSPDPARRLRSEPRAAVPRRGRGAAGARLPAGARRRAAGARLTYARRARSRRRARRGAARARALGRAAGDDPVGQRDRSRAADARRLHGRRAGRADLGRVFAAEPGLRQAQAYRRAARSPASIYVADTAPFAKALAAIGARRRNRREPQRRKPRAVTPFDDLARTPVRPRGRAGRRRRAAPTRSRNSCSPPARPACPRA